MPPKQAVPLPQLLGSALWEGLSRAGDPLLILLGILECSHLESTLVPGADPATLTIIPPGIQCSFSVGFMVLYWVIPF